MDRRSTTPGEGSTLSGFTLSRTRATTRLERVVRIPFHARPRRSESRLRVPRVVSRAKLVRRLLEHVASTLLLVSQPSKQRVRRDVLVPNLRRERRRPQLDGAVRHEHLQRLSRRASASSTSLGDHDLDLARVVVVDVVEEKITIPDHRRRRRVSHDEGALARIARPLATHVELLVQC